MDLLELVNEVIKNNQEKLIRDNINKITTLIENGKKIGEIAEKFNLEPSVLINFLKEHNILHTNYHETIENYNIRTKLKGNDNNAKTAIEMKDTESEHLEIIKLVEYINKHKSIKKAEKDFGTSAVNIRLKLKSHGYRYDSLFDMWTKKSRKELIEEYKEKLDNGIITYKDLIIGGVDIERFKEEIRKE